jgi:hypothetical protein
MVRRIPILVAIVMLAAACGGSDDTAGDAASQVVELQAEVNRLRAQLDLVTTGTTSAGATTVPIAPGQAVDLVPVFDVVFVGIAERISELDDAAQRANTAWDAKTGSFDDTHDRFTTLVADAAALSDVVGLLPVPIELATRYTEVIAAIEEFELAARALLAGLEAPDDGSLRRNAAARLTDTATQVLQAATFG